MSRSLVEQVIEQLNLPIRVVGGVERTDAILTLKANLRKHANLRRMAEGYRVPLYIVKFNTVAQIANTLQQIAGREDRVVEPMLKNGRLPTVGMKTMSGMRSKKHD